MRGLIMPMPPYPVLCYGPDCNRIATFKIAARWSDGTTHELKTYYLACSECLPGLVVLARAKQKTCRLAHGESLDPPAVYDLVSGSRDRNLVRRVELESATIPTPTK